MLRPLCRSYKKTCKQKGKLRILVLCNYIYPYSIAGAEIHAYYVSNKLVEKGHDVCLIAIAPRKRVEHRAKVMFKQRLVRPWSRPFAGLAYVFQVFLFAYIKRRKFDVIQVHNADTGMIPVYMLSKIAGKPYIVTCHGSDIRIRRKSAFTRCMHENQLQVTLD